MKQNVVPRPPGIHALDLHREARSYVRAARVLGRENQHQMNIRPRYFVLCHGLELALKSFLAAHGDNEEVLKGIRHDLKKAYNRAKKKPEFPVSDEWLRRLVEDMAPEHKGLWFRYPGAPYTHLPDINQCCDVVDKLLRQIESVVIGAYKEDWRKLDAQDLEYDPEL